MAKVAQKKKTPNKISKAEEPKKIMFEEDDSEEDDDDDDVEDDEEDEDVSGEEVDMDDEDDEEEDDDDEDDDEEEDEDDEEDTPVAKSPQKKNVQKNTKIIPEKSSPKKKLKNQAKNEPTEMTPGKQTPKGQKRKAEDLPQSNKKPKPVFDAASNEADIARLEERDRKSLYVNFGAPVGGDIEKIKSLSSDILAVRSPKFKARFAFLEFESEKIAEKNFKILQTKTLGNQKLIVDYVGAKSNKNPKKAKPDVRIDKLKLFIGRLPEGTTEEDLKEAFPKAKQISIPHANKKKPARFAFVVFNNENDANSTYEESSSKFINGKEVIVLHAKAETFRQKKKAMQKQKGKKPNQKGKQRPAFQKKTKRSSDGEEDDEGDSDE